MSNYNTPSDTDRILDRLDEMISELRDLNAKVDKIEVTLGSVDNTLDGIEGNTR